MGCDIHAHMEVKINNEWYHYSVLQIPRNYELFERMAGVRGDVENAIFPPRGMPDDSTVVTQLACDFLNVDGHSHSWVSSEEFKEIYTFHKNLCPNHQWFLLDHKVYGYLFGNSFEHFHEYRNNYPQELQDFRMIFWFDN